MWIRLGVLAFLGLLCWAWLGLLRPYMISQQLVEIQIDDEKIAEALQPRSVEFIEKTLRNPLPTHANMPMKEIEGRQRVRCAVELPFEQTLAVGLLSWARAQQGILLIKTSKRADAGVEVTGEVLSAGDGLDAAVALSKALKQPWMQPHHQITTAEQEALLRKVLLPWNREGPLATATVLAKDGQSAFLVLEPVTGKTVQTQFVITPGSGEALKLELSVVVLSH